MKKFLLWIVVIIGLIWLFKNPYEAGDVIRQAANHVIAFANSL